MKHLSAAALVGILFFSVSACAQVPGNAPAGIPLLDEKSVPVDDDVRNLNDFNQTPAMIDESQRTRQQERDIETKEGGFEWQPWSKAGLKIFQFITEREPYAKWDLNDQDVNVYYDFAVSDVDQDNEPDIITYKWADCGTLGCTFTVYYNNKSRKPQTYYGHKLRPFKKGVMLDDKAYFSY